MKEITAYKCEFCNKVMVIQGKMVDHEKKCIKKPKGFSIKPFDCENCPPLSKMKCSLDKIKDCLIKE